MLVPTLPKPGATRRQLWTAGAIAAVVGVYAVGALILPGKLFDPAMDAFIDNAPILLAVLVAAPVGLWIAQRPQRGVLLLVATVPYWGLDIILPIPSGWKETLALYTLLWTLLSIVFKPRPQYPLPKVVQAFAGYFGIALLSAAIVRGTQAEVGLKVGFFWVLMAVMVWLRPLDARERDHVVTIMIVNALITSLVGLAQQAIGAGRLVSLGYEYDTTVRFTGHFLRSFSTFKLPFDFGFYLALVIVIGTSMSLREPKRPRSILFFASLPVIMLGLLFTFVRGAYLVVAIGVLYLAITRFRWLFLGVPVALLLLLLVPGQYATPTLGATSLGQRSQSWTDHISTIFDPVGHGIGLTGSAGEKVEKLLKSNADVYQPDNQYFKTIYELGVMGLFFFVLLLLSSFWTARAAVPRLHGRDQALAEGLTAHILGVMAACFVATYFEIFPMDFFFWLLLSIVVTCDRTSS
jgi:O-antigen ligase/polysaccharide polymerase Wzy-like membrane protein